VGYALIAQATQGWMIYALTPLLALGGIAGPAVQAIITSNVGPKEQGELQGALNSMSGLAAIIGPLIGTSLLAWLGTPGAPVLIPGAPFFAAAACSALGLVLAMRAMGPAPAPAPASAPAAAP